MTLTAREQTNVFHIARAQGRRIARELIELLEDTDVSGRCLLRSLWEGPPARADEIAECNAEEAARMPQRNIVLEYLDRVSGDRDVLEGFCSLLSDWIATCSESGVWDADHYTPEIIVTGIERRQV